MIKIIYNDIALGAAEDATVSTTAGEEFSNPAAVLSGVEAPAIATCELNGWGLTHDYIPRDKQALAFWSTQRSGTDCVFSSPPTITLTFSEQYTSTGLTLRFAPESMDFCRKISVVWYQGSTVKNDGTFYPTSPVHIINNAVIAFDKIVITFSETNLPGKRAKIEGITIGVKREFGTEELTSAKLTHEIDLISDTVPVNVLDAAFHSSDDVEYIFQRKQPVSAYIKDKLAGVYYIESGKRTGSQTYKIACQDIVGVLDLYTQPGGIWFEDTPLTSILTAIFGDVVTFEIDPAYASATLRGYIEPETTMREALQQIAFALGACVDTTGTAAVKIFPPPTGTGTEISAKETYTGGSVDTEDTVTEVTVTAYVITDERPGTDDESVELNGVEYKYYTDTKHAYNPNSVASDLPNKVKFIGMYLVNLSNAQTLADNIMAYYMRRNTYKFSHVVSDEKPGDRAKATLPWGDVENGNIRKMTVSVTGLVVSDTEMLLDE